MTDMKVDTKTSKAKKANKKQKQDEAGVKSAKTSAVDTEKFEAVQKELDEMKDKFLRMLAEFENYKKRTIKEKVDMLKTASQDTLISLLPVLDDFDRAKKSADDESTDENFSEGVTLVYSKLYQTLKSKGLEEMTTTGEIFDPEMHEAISEIPVPDKSMKGKIVDTVEKGYLLGDKIIRYAKVVVGK